MDVSTTSVQGWECGPPKWKFYQILKIKKNEISEYKRQSIAYPLYNCYKFFRACKEFYARSTVKTWGDFGAMWV